MTPCVGKEFLTVSGSRTGPERSQFTVDPYTRVEKKLFVKNQNVVILY